MTQENLTQPDRFTRMITTINGREPQPWPDDVRALWIAKVEPKLNEHLSVERANYFAPRPYVDEYNTGSNKAGFVYTVTDVRNGKREVWRSEWLA